MVQFYRKTGTDTHYDGILARMGRNRLFRVCRSHLWKLLKIKKNLHSSQNQVTSAQLDESKHLDLNNIIQEESA